MSENARPDESEPPRTSSPNNPPWWRRNLPVLGLGAVVVLLAVALTVVLIRGNSSSARVGTNAAQTSDSISAGPESDLGVPPAASPSSEWADPPSTTDAWTPDAGTDSPAPLSITESGFTYIPDGNFVTWGAVLADTGEDWSSVDVSATALDGAGNALDSDTASVIRVASGATYVGGTFIHASNAVASVKVAIGSPGAPYSENHPPINGTLTAKSRVLQSGIDGSLSVRFASTIPFPVKSGSAVDFVFRDSNGAIIGGAENYLPAAIPANDSVSMAINSVLIPPHTASADVSVDIFVGY